MQLLTEIVLKKAPAVKFTQRVDCCNVEEFVLKQTHFIWYNMMQKPSLIESQ